MIRGLVDFALNNRWLMVGATIILFAWGAISFHDLPVEAYPDVANNYVQIITQWPGRAAEEVEQQVTIPIEIQMAGIPHLQHLRSTSLAGLSSVMLIFDDDSVNKDNRQEVVPASRPGHPSRRPAAADGHRLEPGRPDLLVHAALHQSRLRQHGVEVALRTGSWKRSSSPSPASSTFPASAA